MRLLLDTHALLWWWADSPRLSNAARHAMVDADCVVLVSVASAWEIAIKQRRGNLSGVPAEAAPFTRQVSDSGFELLAITLEHAMLAGYHPAEHRDPFDRMLAAQAEIEDAVLVSCDVALDQFGVRRLW